MGYPEPTTVPPPKPPAPVARSDHRALITLRVLVLLFLFLVGITGMGTGFKGLGKDLLEGFFRATDNPFVGLTIGILATTLVQSSSVTTSMIVSLVAAPDNPLPIQNAVPMVMGANIGTTVTNTIVSMGHVGQREEFRRAFAAATCHDFFNYLSVIVLLPLELLFGVLSKPAASMAEAMGGEGLGSDLPNPIKDATKAVVSPVADGLQSLFSNKQVAAAVLVLLSAVVIFASLMFLVRTLRKLAAGRLQAWISRSLGRSGYIGILVGIIVTVAVQSSSITTSVLVPLAGAGIVTLQQLFPVTLGANIGTTLTAIIASSASGDATQALKIAFVHLLFNVVGLLLVYPLEFTRRIPLAAAEWLAGVATRSKKVALFYVAGLFYGLPALFVVVFH